MPKVLRNGVVVDVEPWEEPVQPAIDWAAVDQAALNEALAQDGSVVRALAELIFEQINVLRVKTGLAAFTKAQFVTALRNKMRT